MKYDDIVVGAGPAGSSAAYHLATAGRKVLVLDKEAFPRYKPCAGALSIKALPLLDFDWQGVVESVPRTVIFSYHPERQVRVELDKPMIYLVARDRFDALLVDRARQAGAEIQEGVTVDSVCVEREEVAVKTKDGNSYRASYVLGADGATSRVAQSLNLLKGRLFGAAVAVEVELDKEARTEHDGVIRVDCGAIPLGYGWIFPKDGYASTGIGTSTRGLNIKQYTNKYLDQEGLGKAKIISRQGHLLPADGGRKKPLTAHRAMLLGDAAGLVDPLTGEGIYYALKSGIIAAGAIIQKDSPEQVTAFYQHSIAKEIIPELTAAGRIAGLFYRFGEILFDLVGLDRRIARYFCKVTGGEISYRLRDTDRKLLRDIREAVVVTQN